MVLLMALLMGIIMAAWRRDVVGNVNGAIISFIPGNDSSSANYYYYYYYYHYYYY